MRATEKVLKVVFYVVQGLHEKKKTWYISGTIPANFLQTFITYWKDSKIK